MKAAKFHRIQGYVRHTYLRVMHAEHGEGFCYTVEKDLGGSVEVQLFITRTSTPLGPPLLFEREPRPVRSRAAITAEARIREHIAIAYGLYQLLQ